MIRTLLLLIFAIAGVAHTTAQPYCDVRTFSLYDGLTANIISRITQTSDDLMWFGTWNGLCYFDGYRFTTFRGTIEAATCCRTTAYSILNPTPPATCG